MFVLYIFFWRRNEKYIKFENPLFNACLQLESNGSKPNVYEQSKKPPKSAQLQFFIHYNDAAFFCCCCCLFACLFVSDENCVEVQNSTRQSLIHKNKINILRFHSLKLNFISFIKPKNKKKKKRQKPKQNNFTDGNSLELNLQTYA